MKNAIANFFKKLFSTAIANPKPTVAGIAGVAELVFPKDAAVIAAASSAVTGALAKDPSSAAPTQEAGVPVTPTE